MKEPLDKLKHRGQKFLGNAPAENFCARMGPKKLVGAKKFSAEIQLGYQKNNFHATNILANSGSVAVIAVLILLF